MNFIAKICKADSERKSRLHDLKGNFVGLSFLVAFPYWIWNWARAKCGSFPVLPWIPPTARYKLTELMRPDWTVLECGSGMSSLWWAKYVRRVISLETNHDWYEMLMRKNGEENHHNLQLHYVSDYSALIKTHAHEANLIVIDGISRHVCAQVAIESLSGPTWIYLDNTDTAGLKSEMKYAEDILLNLGERLKFKQYYRGVPPGQLAPTEGLLVLVDK